MFMNEKDFRELIAKDPSLVKSYSLAMGKVPRSNKYRNVKLYEYADGMVSETKDLSEHGAVINIFDSMKEYDRWMQLKLLEKSGEISELERQKTMLIQGEFTYRNLQGERRISKIAYKADFFYRRNGVYFVEDVKPFDNNTGRYRLTKDFTLKWKLLMNKYPSFQFVII